VGKPPEPTYFARFGVKGCKKTIAPQKDCVRFATFIWNNDRFERKNLRAVCSEKIKLPLLERLRPFPPSYKKLKIFGGYGIKIAKKGVNL
jgi:hypothetical protein